MAVRDRCHGPAAGVQVGILAVVLSLVSLAGCADVAPSLPPAWGPTGERSGTAASPTSAASTPGAGTPAADAPVPRQFDHLLPGMPGIVDQDVYGATRAGMLAAAVVHDPALLYVPDSAGSSVTVISQRSHKILRVLHAGSMSQHVSPSYNLRSLYIDSSAANELVERRF